MLLIEEINNIDDLQKIETEWNDLFLDSKDCSVFQGYDFNKIWFLIYGQELSLHIVSVKDGATNKCVAIFPFYFKKQNAFRRIHFIGDSWFDYTMILATVSPDVLVSELSNYFYKLRGWDFIYFNSFIAESATAKFLDLFQNKKFIVNRSSVASAPIINLDCTWESYYKSIKTRIKQDTNRQIKRLGELGSLELREIAEHEIGENLENFFRMYVERWKSVDKISKFENKLNREFIKQICQSAHGKKQLAFHKLMLDKKVLAYHLGFKDSYTFYYYIPVFNPEYGQFSVGRILLMKLLKLCIDESIRNFDLMAGDEKYKSDFANGSKSIERAYIFKKNLKGRILYYFQSHK